MVIKFFEHGPIGCFENLGYRTATVEVLAPLTECALNIDVSIPDFVRIVLIQWAMVALEAGSSCFVDVKKIAPCV